VLSGEPMRSRGSSGSARSRRSGRKDGRQHDDEPSHARKHFALTGGVHSVGCRPHGRVHPDRAPTAPSEGRRDDRLGGVGGARGGLKRLGSEVFRPEPIAVTCTLAIATRLLAVAQRSCNDLHRAGDEVDRVPAGAASRAPCGGCTVSSFSRFFPGRGLAIQNHPQSLAQLHGRRPVLPYTCLHPGLTCGRFWASRLWW
jgi:hypothetical protein